MEEKDIGFEIIEVVWGIVKDIFEIMLLVVEAFFPSFI